MGGLWLFQTWGADIFSDPEENVPITTFNKSLESTPNKQQYGANIICTEVREKQFW